VVCEFVVVLLLESREGVGFLQVELCGKSGEELISKSYVSMNCTELTLWG
jgi:hypothetical protein